jgi:hypothetical protein
VSRWECEGRLEEGESGLESQIELGHHMNDDDKVN